MMVTKDIYTLLDETGYPYYRQGSIPAGNTDSSYFTLWNVASAGYGYFDNDNHMKERRYGVAFYTGAPELLEDGPLDAFIDAAKEAGWVIEQFPYDTPSNIPEKFGRYTRISGVTYT